ncbi:MAG TPA: hypothetical protein VH592_02590 [Gemmataceae bacterium]|jgi:hypothetical protein
MMLLRVLGLASLLTGFLLVGLLPAQFTFRARQHGDMEAHLTVEAGKHTAKRGLGELTLTLTITGPPTLQVEEPRLGDAAAAWKDERLTSTLAVQNQRAVWSQVVRLKQVKGGMEPVPDVTVRFRRQPEDEWIEEKWIDILRNIRDGSEPPQPEKEGASWLRRWGFVIILAATGLLVLVAWLSKRRHIRRDAPIAPDLWALGEIERIEKTLMPPQGEATAFHTQISLVVRRYLTERFGLPALQQTTAEFLESARQIPQLPEQAQALLTELFERCDLAKFARADTSPAECQRTAELARILVQQTVSSSLIIPKR